MTGAFLVAVRALAVLGMSAVVVPTVLVAHDYYRGGAGASMAGLLWLVPAGQIGVAVFLRARVALTERRGPVPPRRRPTGLLLAALLVLLIIDVSKAWSLGFALPGMREEFALTEGQALLLPLACLLGSVLSSFYFGALADRFGTRTMAFFSGLGCTGTALCGVTGSFPAAAACCFALGLAVGGLVPIVFALLPYLLPRRRVTTAGLLLAGAATTGGYLLAYLLAQRLLPEYGWRGLWLSGAVTGPLLLAGTLVLPDWVPGYSGPPRHLPTLGRRRPALVLYGLMAGALCVGYVNQGPSLAGYAGLVGGDDVVQAFQAALVLPAALGMAFALRRLPAARCLHAVGAWAGWLVIVCAAALAGGVTGAPIAVLVVAVGVATNLMVVAVLGVAWQWYGRPAGVAGIGVVLGVTKFGALVGPAMIVDSVSVAIPLGAGTIAAAAFVQQTFGTPLPGPGGTVPPPAPSSRHVHVVIVGAGFAGLGMAIRLAQQGIRDFVVLDRATDVGGTWRDNTYPGCACDVPSNLYSYSFVPNPDWSRCFSPQPEIHRYLRRCVARYRLAAHLRLGQELRTARWDDGAGHWVIRTGRVELTAGVLICATGPLSEPVTPRLTGVEWFTGTTFHSAAWDHRHDLRGERVAVIGTGASAVQFVPEIVDAVAQLYVFQRTPPWVVPRWDRPRSPLTRRAFRALPALQRLARSVVYWGREALMLGLGVDHRLLKVAEWLARWHLRRQVRDPALRAALTPRYAVGCKRLVVSSDYYPALTRPDVELVTSAVREVGERWIVTADGTRRAVDTIIYGTGFALANTPVAGRLYGRNGRNLAEEWAGGAAAYLGTAVAGFPNLFLLAGPNSVLGHNSVILGVEAQISYVLSALRTMRRRGLAAVEVRPEVQDSYNDGLRTRMWDTVWLSGCRSWYLDAAGRNTTLWPGFTASLRRRTRRFDLSDYHLLRGTGESAGGRSVHRRRADRHRLERRRAGRRRLRRSVARRRVRWVRRPAPRPGTRRRARRSRPR
ncbi:MFS transporter [Plantactinospora sp. S1510]|uniref:MFS transporter n=1 Tax=Plantactinospora alkalitolerans TaxID=2789879 RepID=A0ABS0H7L1_9ACTN|nr:MFS transporter [Plantactinospora alkalitolerans]MBF9134455.1 MFS transporter [Plantactinospora alkalitolerans]